MMMSFLQGRLPDDRTIVRYVLGALPDDETDQLDELSIADDEFALRLSAIEHNLVDAYVNGELGGDDLRRFKSHLLWSSARRAQVDFAEALQQYRRPEPPADAIARARAFVPTWLLSQPVLAAATVALLAFAVYVVADNLRLRNEAAALRTASVTARERARQLEGQLNNQRSATSEAARELARLRQSLAQLEAREESRQTASSVLAFVLAPTMRDASTPATIAVPRRSPTVTLRLQLDADDFPAYRAILKDAATDRILWRSASLHASGDSRSRSLSIVLPATALEPKVYVVEVMGVTPRGETDVIATYPFRVVRQ
jgi:hypothetical protein